MLPYVIVHSLHLINRLPSYVIQNKCPYELLYDNMPNLSNIKVIGCLYFASTLDQNSHKLDPRVRKCIFLGFKHRTKGYVVMDVLSKEIFVSQNLIFYKTYFYDLSNKND